MYTRQELRSRYDIQLENYCKVISIEAHTMLDMVNQEIMPAILAYSGQAARDASAKRQLIAALDLRFEEKLVARLTGLINSIGEKTESLEKAVQGLETAGDALAQARYCQDCVFQRMQALRAFVDEAETIVDKRLWPFPGYGELLTTK